MENRIKLVDLVEFAGDLKKQCIVLMGLPAAAARGFSNDKIKEPYL